MSKLRRLLSFNRADVLLLAQAWAALMAVDLGVRLASFDAVQRAIDRRLRTRGANTPERLQRFVRLAARHHLWPMACLPQALALRWLLVREGFQAIVLIGVRKDRGQVEAHAWVELNGQPLGEGADVRQRFRVMQAAAVI